ncbi:hypothetical protein L226DRAFT_442341, partial [Lentinus tigrinus ALCF2SS1-7]|uniref:uncharacterized protein n=1 Tax=Lentinus tigrinus ALCF2SS1-7 TaxID=1328758 RepID=UPI001165E2EC
MNVSFTKRDPINTTVMDDGTGHMLYDVFTAPWWHLGVSTTTIIDTGGHVVAEYERRLVGYDRVKLHGITTRMLDWLPRRNWWSSDRMLTTPDGQVYVWKSKWNNTFKVIDSNVLVVETHNASWGFLNPSHRGGMSVHPELTPFLVDILLSFIICERERRAKEAA